MKINRLVISFALFFLMTLLLVAGVKGNKEQDTQVGGPFESSGSRSRYALTEAIVKNNTFFFNKEQAKFSAPDFVEYNNKFFSIFTPGVSFLGIPFYIFGKWFRLPQLFTFLSTLMFAVFNVFLVTQLARKLGAGIYSAFLSGLIFLFASNALSYALTFTQHHASTTILLLALLNIFGERSLLKNLWFGVLLGIGLLFDLPNIIIISPIALYILLKTFRVIENKNLIKLSFNLNIIGIIIGFLPFLILFSWYNYQLTGSYTKIGQMIGRSDYFEPLKAGENKPLETEQFNPYSPRLPFNTRNQLVGLYTLLISNERGWFYYSPIVAIGLLGMFLSYKNKSAQNKILLLIAVILTTIIVYSLHGDPWGGWAFGSRYLVPSTAILCSFIGVAFQKYRKNPLFFSFFFVLLIYSLVVNIVGALTTTQVPPKVEAVNLLNPIPYTYEYNFQLLRENKISPLFYNLYLSDKISATQFIYGYYATVLLLMLVTTGGVLLEEHGKKQYG